MTIPDLIREERNKRNLTQEAFAKAVGIGIGTAWRLERETDFVPSPRVRTLLEAFLDLEPGTIWRAAQPTTIAQEEAA